jgi:ATP-dependent DNA ligase
MLARSEETLPSRTGWLYEPKLDGFRAIVFRDGATVHIDSRNGKPLARYFPELVIAMQEALPDGSAVDGEIVVYGEHGIDFEALQTRLNPSSGNDRAALLPASFVAFDLLANRGVDITIYPFAKRRARLEKALRSYPSVSITPQTADREAASVWLTEFRSAGVEGVIAKRSDLPYRPGERLMVKVRLRKTVDCVVGGYVADGSGGPSVLVLGLYDERGVLHHIGQTTALSAVQRQDAARRLLHGGRSFGDGRMPGRSRWGE